MTTIVWPPPCRSCGSTTKQQTEWNTDAKNFKQRCHVCGHQGDWEPYIPVRVGYGLDRLAKAVPYRRDQIEVARGALTAARKLSLANVPLRERIDAIIEEIDDCLRTLTP